MYDDKDEEIRSLHLRLQEKEQAIKDLELKLLEKANRLEQEEENDDEELDLGGNISKFISNFSRNQSKVERIDLYLSVINAMSVLYHVDYDEELLNGSFSDLADKKTSRFNATKLAFNYTVQFFRQRNLSNGEYRETDKLSFPLMWLMGMFPYNQRDFESTTDLALLPLHFFLAVDPKGIPIDQYLQDLDTILNEFGVDAFHEEVSPLSIAVAKSYPILAVIEKIFEYNSNSDILEDEDGSIPLMHACACNESTDIISFLLKKSPKSLEKVDNFGASAIHYATFTGSYIIVKYLLENFPGCETYLEGNGALPCHDGVQNCRGYHHQLEITKLLLELSPEAAFKRDNAGALPFHRAVKSSSYQVAQLLVSVFPKAVFAADAEGLLPIHYFSQREDKDNQLDLLQYILELNPKGTTLNDSELFPKAKKSSFSFFNRTEKSEDKRISMTSASDKAKPPQHRKSVVMNRRTSSAHHLPRIK